MGYDDVSTVVLRMLKLSIVTEGCSINPGGDFKALNENI